MQWDRGNFKFSLDSIIIFSIFRVLRKSALLGVAV